MPTTPPEPLFFQRRCFEVDLTVAARQAGEEAKGRRSPAKQPAAAQRFADTQNGDRVLDVLDFTHGIHGHFHRNLEKAPS